jgi:Tol biopolymer transport system component
MVAALSLALGGCAATGAPSRPASSAATDAFLPDEPRLLFEWFPPGSSMKTIFLAQDDGLSAVAVTTDVATDVEHVHADWSPDGMQIAFEALADAGPASIWITDADGAHAVETIVCESAGCLQQSYPSWSPDGKSIVFVQGDGVDGRTWGPASIVVMNLATKERRTLAVTADGTAAYYSPRWSRDGTRIVAQYETYPDAEESEISSSEVVVMPADGSSAPVGLTTPALFAGHPDWSPTEDLIVFDSYDLSAFFPVSPGDTNVYVMNPDGSEVRQLTNTTLDQLQRIGEPTWTPDGKRIVASRGVLAAPDNKSIIDALIVFVDPSSGEVTVTGVQGAQVRLQPTPDRSS